MSLHRSPPFRIFVVIFLAAIFFAPGDLQGNANTVSRMGTVFSLAQNGSFRIDRFAAYTTDRAEVAGYSYSDKAPGQSLVALIPAAAMIKIWSVLGFPEDPIIHDKYTSTYMAALWISIAFTSAMFTALASAWIYILCRYFGASALGAAVASLGYGICTPALGWASVLFSHGMAAGCILLSYGIVTCKLDRVGFSYGALRYSVFAGFMMGLAVISEFTAILAALIVSWIVYANTNRYMFLGYILGALPCAIFIAAYNLTIFGSATALSYGSVVGFDAMRNGAYGLRLPRISVLFELIAGRKRGILWLAPWLILAPIAFWFAIRRWGWRFGTPGLCIVAAYFILNSSYHYWDGGWSTGPRHIVAALPFLCLPFAALWDESSPPMRITVLALLAISAAFSIVSASVGMAAPGHFQFPLRDYLLPNFVSGKVHNHLTLMGVSGATSLLVMPPLIAIGVIWLRAASWGPPTRTKALANDRIS